MKKLLIVAMIVGGTIAGRAAPILSIQNKTNSVEISWPTVDGTISRPWRSTNLQTFTKLGLPIQNTGGIRRITLPKSSSREFYKVEFPMIAGELMITNGSRISGETWIDISALAAIPNELQYIGLMNLGATNTNTIATIDARNMTDRFFSFDSHFLSNGIHRLQMELVDTDGPLTSEGVNVSYSDIVTVTASNAISVLSDKQTEWMRYLKWRTPSSSGTWTVRVTNNLNRVIQTTNGTLTRAETDIIVKDSLAATDNDYASDYFDYLIEVRSAGRTNSFWFRSDVVHIWDYEGFVAVQDGIINPANAFFDPMMDTVVFNMCEPDLFNLETLTRDFVDETVSYNVLSNSTSWQSLKSYLSGQFVQPPSHIWLAGNFGPGWFGSSVQGSGLTVQDLLDLPPSVKFTFAFLDMGCLPKSFAYLAIGTDRKLTRKELQDEGKRPHVAFFWNRRSFGELRNPTAREASMRTYFISKAWEINPGWGKPGYGLFQVLDMTRAAYPTESAGLDYVGCSRVFIDEIYLTFFE